MKQLSIILTLILAASIVSAQNLKPYKLAVESTESIDDTKAQIFSSFKANGIEVLGEYRPANDNNRWIVVFTSPDLVKAVSRVGGLRGFAAALRVGITREDGKTLVSYTDPEYWGNAYFQDDFSKVAAEYKRLSAGLVSALESIGTYKGTGFGSEDGISAEDLREYHYMFGMPYFEDTIELGEFSSHSDAVKHIDSRLKEGVPNIKQVYRVEVPGKELVLYGFALSGPEGESSFLPVIDIGKPKHTGFLPYEMLVMGKEVYMLHGRFRIALSFPDLTMGTFTKIMSTPGDIEELLEQLVK